MVDRHVLILAVSPETRIGYDGGVQFLLVTNRTRTSFFETSGRPDEGDEDPSDSKVRHQYNPTPTPTTPTTLIHTINHTRVQRRIAQTLGRCDCTIDAVSLYIYQKPTQRKPSYPMLRVALLFAVFGGVWGGCSLNASSGWEGYLQYTDGTTTEPSIVDGIVGYDDKFQVKGGTSECAYLSSLPDQYLESGDGVTMGAFIENCRIKCEEDINCVLITSFWHGKGSNKPRRCMWFSTNETSLVEPCEEWSQPNNNAQQITLGCALKTETPTSQPTGAPTPPPTPSPTLPPIPEEERVGIYTNAIRNSGKWFDSNYDECHVLNSTRIGNFSVYGWKNANVEILQGDGDWTVHDTANVSRCLTPSCVAENQRTTETRLSGFGFVMSPPPILDGFPTAETLTKNVCDHEVFDPIVPLNLTLGDECWAVDDTAGTHTVYTSHIYVVECTEPDWDGLPCFYSQYVRSLWNANTADVFKDAITTGVVPINKDIVKDQFAKFPDWVGKTIDDNIPYSVPMRDVFQEMTNGSSACFAVRYVLRYQVDHPRIVFNATDHNFGQGVVVLNNPSQWNNDDISRTVPPDVFTFDHKDIEMGSCYHSPLADEHKTNEECSDYEAPRRFYTNQPFRLRFRVTDDDVAQELEGPTKWNTTEVNMTLFVTPAVTHDLVLQQDNDGHNDDRSYFTVSGTFPNDAACISVCNLEIRLAIDFVPDCTGEGCRRRLGVREVQSKWYPVHVPMTYSSVVEYDGSASELQKVLMLELQDHEIRMEDVLVRESGEHRFDVTILTSDDSKEAVRSVVHVTRFVPTDSGNGVSVEWLILIGVGSVLLVGIGVVGFVAARRPKNHRSTPQSRVLGQFIGDTTPIDWKVR